jgi:HEAT repeat protein
MQALEDEDSSVQIAAAKALGKIRSGKALRPLIEALKDEDHYVRNAADWALKEIRSEKGQVKKGND